MPVPIPVLQMVTMPTLVTPTALPARNTLTPAHAFKLRDVEWVRQGCSWPPQRPTHVIGPACPTAANNNPLISQTYVHSAVSLCSNQTTAALTYSHKSTQSVAKDSWCTPP